MDDLVIFFSTLKDYLAHLDSIFSVLIDLGIALLSKKLFLGYLIV